MGRSASREWVPPVPSPNMDSPLAASLMDLWNTPGVQENLEQSARVFFSNSFQTINLIPALLVGGGGGASYGSNLEISDGYGAPSSSYGAPESSYGAPAASYDAPASNSYDAPVSNGYDTPSSGYDAGRRKRSVELPTEARDLYASLNLADQVYNSNGASQLTIDNAFAPAQHQLGGGMPLLN